MKVKQRLKLSERQFNNGRFMGYPSTSEKSARPALQSTQGGFALVIALALMAFIVLLLLSISAFVRVETSSAQIGLDRMQAQQNALLGLQQALGELQKAAGPDQRITVISDMFDSDPAASEVIAGVSTRHYVGVYLAHQTAQPLEAFRATQDSPGDALKWLASSANPSTDPVLANPVSESVSTDSKLSVDIAKVFQSDTGTVESIFVGKVPVLGGSQGSFAWWVADEGMKAKFNTVDPGIGLTATDDPIDNQKLPLIQVRQSNFAHVSESFDKKFSDLLSDGSLSKLNSSRGFYLLSEEWGEWMLPQDPTRPGRIASVNPDFTLFSQGLPVDVTQGRLKEDLTVYLETGKGLNDDGYIVRAPGDSYLTGLEYIGPSFGVNRGNPATDNLPRFGLLRSWSELGKSYGRSGSAPNQPHSNTTHGLHPIVMRAGFAFSLGRVGQPVQDPDEPDNMLVDLQVMVFPRVTLLNPYNFKLPPEEYLVEITLPKEIILHWRGTGTTAPLNPKTSGDHVVVLDFLDDGAIQRDNYTWMADRAWMRVTLDTGDGNPEGMWPGETRNFSPVLAQQPLADSRYVDQRADAFRAGAQVNLMEPICRGVNENRYLEKYFAVGPPKTVSVPKAAIGPFTAAETDGQNRIYNVRYFVHSPASDLENNLSWRLNLLSGTSPTLLSTKDPTKTTRGASSYDQPINFEGWSYRGSNNFDLIRPVDPLLPHWNVIFTAMSDTWAAAAASGRFMEGGDRRNSTHNPRGGILRGDLDASNWDSGGHRISAHNVEPYHEFFYRRWQQELNEHWNPGTYDGYTANESRANSRLNGGTGTRFTLYDFPRRFGPITSLGQLQHVNLNPFGFGSAYQVGFSRAPYHVKRENLVETANTATPNERIDLPFMLNASLWDRFYLSTIPQNANLNLVPGNMPVLANNRHILTPSSDGSFPNTADLRDSITGFTQSAAYIHVDGAFNVNSVSVEAWEAILLQAAGKTVATEQSGNLNSAGDETFVAFPRFPDPVYGVGTNETFQQLDASHKVHQAGMFVTNRDGIGRLAEEIVAEVKRRGPFLSLADFINRRQIPDSTDLDEDYLGLMGTLDAAIMRASQVEDVLNYNQIFGSVDPWDSTQYLDPEKADRNNVLDYSVDAEAGFGVPFGHANTANEGSSGNLIQGDLLQAIGPQLSARSDTFVIRSYGEATAPISGQPRAKARCEAVVQRISEPVDVNDSLIAPTREFGRRFVVVAFRWLDEDS